MLFDTDVLIWVLRGNNNAVNVINSTKERSISIVNYMELIQGARNKQEQLLIQRFLNDNNFIVLPISEAISRRAMNLIEQYALSSGLRVADALVFATACEHSLILCSANQKHFRVVSSLKSQVFSPNN